MPLGLTNPMYRKVVRTLRGNANWEQGRIVMETLYSPFFSQHIFLLNIILKRKGIKMEKEYIKKFLKASGLKYKAITDYMGVPAWVLTHYLNSTTNLSKAQSAKLETFVDNFISNNAYVIMQ